MTPDRVDHPVMALCAEHVLPLLERDARRMRDDRTMPEARKAASAAHDSARETDGAAALATRSAGHAAATDHVAGHAVHAANYALQAVQAADSSVDDDRAWQEAQVPERLFRVVSPGSGPVGAWEVKATIPRQRCFAHS
ncbi:putative immunity protein [Nocardia sp. CA-128927]|uniref:putative immunity protein n=1 Tax=Nocardia sp. CA-128927 TaxID=3239975 RepID=UPI003D9537B4